MKIYTRKGDDGSTGLVTGERVPKHDDRVEMYGTCDELNSFMGHADSLLTDDVHAAMKAQLKKQQCLLFELGSELAGFVARPGESVIYLEDIEELEGWMDEFSEDLEELKAFVLPGGTQAASVLHLCRTVCRRLERQMTECLTKTGSKLGEEGVIVMPQALQYINRLSDYFFVAARKVNQVSGNGDIPWVSRGKQVKKESK